MRNCCDKCVSGEKCCNPLLSDKTNYKVIIVNTTSVQSNCRLHLPLQVDNRTVKALIDTGSQGTVISVDFVPSIPISKTPDRLFDAAGNPLKVIGIADVPFCAQRRNFTFSTYVVEDLVDEAIIGYDFIQSYGAIINFPGQKFTLTAGRDTVSVPIPLCDVSTNAISSKLVNKVNLSKSVARIGDLIKVQSEIQIDPGFSISIDLNLAHNEIFKVNDKLVEKVKLSINFVNGRLLISNETENKKRLRQNYTIGEIFPGNKLVSNNNNVASVSKVESLSDPSKIHEVRQIPAKGLITLVAKDEAKTTVLKDSEGFVIDINKELDSRQYSLVADTLKNYLEMFTQDAKNIGLADVKPQEVPLIDHTPVKRRNYQLAIREKSELLDMIKTQVKTGVLSRRRSKYESPVFLKRKPDKKFRLLVDFRGVNQKIDKSGDRVPLVDAFWPTLRDKKYFVTLDFNSGYFQIPLSEKSKEITGINVEGVSYVFNSIPQGLNISPYMFQSIMNDVLYDFLWQKCVVYLDDICIFGKTFDETLENLKEVLNRLKEKKFKLKTSKCKFFYHEVELLGHVVGNNILKPLNKNLDAIKNLQPPKTLNHVRKILGTLNYYRKFIKNFAKLTLPLSNILLGTDSTSNAKLKEWTNEQQEAFEETKKLLLSEPILHLFDPDAETLLEVDASSYAIGAVLCQIDSKTNEKHPVGYFSEKLPQCQRHLGSVDLETIGITRGCQYLDIIYWVKDSRFILTISP